MSKITLPTITNGQDLTTLNTNFSKIASALNDDVLYRDNPTGEANQLENDVDANGNNLFNVGLLSAEDISLNGQSINDTISTALTAIEADIAIANAQANAATNSAANANTQAVASAASASSATASAAAASGTLANALVKTNNLSDVANAVTAKANLGMDQVVNTSDANKPVSTAQAIAIALKANIASPTFTGTVGGITAAMVGLGSVNNTADSAKPVSTAQAAAIALKTDLAASISSGVFTDVTASRAFTTSYTNSTGRPIFVIVTGANSTASTSTMAVFINSVLAGYSSSSPALSSAITNISFLVPIGAIYQVNIQAGAPTVSRWTEVR